MTAVRANLGTLHTESFINGLFGLQLKRTEGIARVFFCTIVGRRITMLHSFIKKTQKTPAREIEVARKRMKEVDMQTYDQVVAKLMRRPGVHKAVTRVQREEGALFDLLLRARHEAGLAQAEVAERMGTQPPSVARLERALATDKHSPSLTTLQRYVEACDKVLVLSLA